MHRLPKIFQFLLPSIFLQWAFCALFRVGFLVNYAPDNFDVGDAGLIRAIYLGAKFDLRLVLLLHCPLLIAGISRHSNPLISGLAQKITVFYFALIYLLLILTYYFDFGYYAYLGNRMDASITRFLFNPITSWEMIRASYPVIPLTLLLIFLWLFFTGLTIRLLRRIVEATNPPMLRWHKYLLGSSLVCLYLFGIYGKFSHYPLRWSEAFFSPDKFVSAVALNPVLYFANTFKNRNIEYDQEKFKAFWPTMSAYLGGDIQHSEATPFKRRVKGNNHFPVNTNVVVIILESFAWLNTGLSGNPLDPSPNFDRLANNGLLFDHFYTPHAGTARSVFTVVTGIPDIELIKTSSRNPLLVDQQTIISQFKPHEKLYFLGGDANWGQIRGFLSHNIPKLRIFEEGSYNSPRADVWGISDLDLFREAHRVFQQQTGPFFAIVQTSGNHRPFTIPPDNAGFTDRSVPDIEAVRSGFVDSNAYNAFRFMDHSIGHFFDLAKQAHYFEDTLFILFGDHGLIRTAAHLPVAENLLNLNENHVPLVFYAPKYIQEAKVFKHVASEVDVLPTAASLVLDQYINTTFGRNLLRDDGKDNYAFTIEHQRGPMIGLINDRYYFRKIADGKERHLYQMDHTDPAKNRIGEESEIAREMETFLDGYYESIKYLRFFNKQVE